MARLGFALFETAIGPCGIAWDGRGTIRAVQLPSTSAPATGTRLRRRCPEAVEAVPPPAVQDAIDRITALLRGEPRDLSGIPLDMADLPPFHRRVYEVARTIPPGATLTYGAVAARLGEPPMAARDVGEALGANPFPLLVPCHRVTAADGRLGGFSAPGGAATKRRLLRIEGAPAVGTLDLFEDPPERV